MLVGWIAGVIFFICLGLRERSWWVKSGQLNSEIDSLKERLEALKIRLEIEETANKFICQENEVSNVTMAHADIIIDGILPKRKQLRPPVKLFDLSGCSVILFSSVARFLESIFSHSGIIPAHKCHGGHESNIKLRSYIANYSPLSSLVSFVIMFLLGVLAWFNIVIPRQSFVHHGLKFVCCWVIAGILSKIFFNISSAQQYLPKSRDDWLKKIRTVDWWLWFGPLAFGMSTMDLAVGEALRLAVKIVVLWPAQYFFYHRSHPTEAESKDVFLINMLIQAAYLMLWINLVRINYFGSPSWIRTGRFLGGALRLSSQAAAVMLLLAMGSFGLCVLRVLWVFWSPALSWWGAFVALGALNVHIAVAVSQISLISACMARFRFLEKVKPVFVDQFIDQNAKAKQQQQEQQQDDERVQGGGRAAGGGDRDEFETSTSGSDLNAKGGGGGGIQGGKQACPDGVAVEGDPGNPKEGRSRSSGEDKDETQTEAAVEKTEKEKEEELKLRAFASSVFHALSDRACRDYVLGVGPVTYYNYNERKKKSSSSAPSGGADFPEKDKEDALGDLCLSFDCVAAHFSMSWDKFDDAWKDVQAERKKAGGKGKQKERGREKEKDEATVTGTAEAAGEGLEGRSGGTSTSAHLDAAGEREQQQQEGPPMGKDTYMGQLDKGEDLKEEEEVGMNVGGGHSGPEPLGPDTAAPFATLHSRVPHDANGDSEQEVLGEGEGGEGGERCPELLEFPLEDMRDVFSLLLGTQIHETVLA